MLSTVDRYLMLRVLRTFLPTCVGLCFLFFAGASFRLLREEKLSLEQIAMALPWVIPFLLPYLLPMAYLTTLTLVYGRMEADNEVLAFGTLGIPARTLAWPSIVLAALLTLAMSWLTTSVVPYCHQMRKEAARAVFQQLFDLGKGEHLSRVFFKQGFDLYVRRYGPEGLEGIVIHYDLPAGGHDVMPMQLVARRGKVGSESGSKRLVLELQDVTATLQPLRAEGDPPSAPIRLHLERYVQGIALGGRRRVKALDYASADLTRVIDTARQRSRLAAATGGALATRQSPDKRGIEGEIELATRTTMALAPMLLTLLVLPLVFMLRARNPLVPFALGLVAACTFFFTPLLLGRSLAESLTSEWPVYLGCATTLVASASFSMIARRR